MGQYTFTKWAGGKIDVEYIVPEGANADTKILLVVPGARRNADDYRDQWLSLAQQHQFIVLAIGCSLDVCQDEYQYNLGGITTPLGALRPESVQFYNVPEKVFHDFVSRFGSSQKTFALYGHSAGGGFVHTSCWQNLTRQYPMRCRLTRHFSPIRTPTRPIRLAWPTARTAIAM